MLICLFPTLIKLEEIGTRLSFYDSLLFENGQVATQFRFVTFGRVKEMIGEYQYTYDNGNLSQVEYFSPEVAFPNKSITFDYDTDIKSPTTDFATAFALFHNHDYLEPELFSKNARTLSIEVEEGDSAIKRDTIFYTVNELGYPASMDTGFGPTYLTYRECQ